MFIREIFKPIKYHTYTHTYIHTHIHTHIHISKTVCNLVRDSPHPDAVSVATSQLNCDKSQVTSFHKMRDIRAGNPRTESSNKSQ